MTMPFVNERPSPHHRSRQGKQITCIVLHADASPTVAGTISWCSDPRSKVSYHYLIGRGGAVYRLVQDDRAAYHAGVSEWRGEKNINDGSLGVCLSNRQDGAEEFAEEQLDAAALVVADLSKRYAIPLLDITTHAVVARPPGRKRDPAPGGPFDYEDFMQRVQAAM